MASGKLKSHNIIRATFSKEITINANSYGGTSLLRTSNESLEDYIPIGLADYTTNDPDIYMYRYDGYFRNNDAVYCLFTNKTNTAKTITANVGIFFMRK